MESLLMEVLFDFAKDLAKFVRRRSWEVICILGLFVIWSYLSRRVGEKLALVFELVLIAVVISIRPVRQRIGSFLRTQNVCIRFSQALSSLPAFESRPPSILQAKMGGHSTHLTLRLRAGTTADLLDNVREDIAVQMRLGSVRVVRDNIDSSVVHVKLVRGAPLSGRVLAWSGNIDVQTSLWDPIEVGIDEDGEAVAAYLPENSLLAGGEPGAGKSVFLNLLLCHICRDPSVQFFIFDGKPPELACWKPLCEGFADTDVDQAIVLLDRIRDLMADRYRRLGQLGLRKVTPECGLGFVVVVVDELPYYIASGKAGKEFGDKFRDLQARGRAAGIIIILTAQKPSSDNVPTSIRDLVTLRVAFRCSTRDASDTILGQGWSSQGYSASSIPLSDRGVGLFLG
ncbi:MAG: hypothetical protein HKL81_04570, partial [Acidimicrobiaceae bacterium]|nr:hypothetical protein [Acidimicrobiaceae bacterium]